MSDVTIEIVDYDPDWPERFRREADRIREAAGDLLVSVEHVGSTAVPGLAAKPIVDICPVAPDMDVAWKVSDRLEAVGYPLVDEREGKPWIEHERVAADGQQFNVHVRPRDANSVARYVLLRDYLRDHPAAREEYARVKREAAERHPHDVGAYTRAKSDVIESTVAAAREAGYVVDL